MIMEEFVGGEIIAENEDIPFHQDGKPMVQPDSGGPVMKHIDHWLSTYSTPKFVRIKDKGIGILNRVLNIGIFVYIFVFTCVYNGSHLQNAHIGGTARITIQQPTDGCNPMHADCNSNFVARNDLPYCLHNSHGPPTLAGALNCTYWDGTDLTDEIPVPGTFFVVSRVTSFVQTRECDPDAAADYGCNTTLYRSPSASLKSKSFYIADIERFTLLFDHGFGAQTGTAAGFWSSESHEVEGQCTDVPGFVETPAGPRPIPSTPDGNFVYPSLHRLPGLGDVISVTDLLKACFGAGEPDLDAARPHDRNRTLRWQGGVVSVKMEYTNRAHWSFFGDGPLQYTMSARLLPLSEFKHMYGAVSEDGMERTVMDSHGILVYVDVGGIYSFFEWTSLFQTLSASIAMFAVSRLVVDFSMSHFQGLHSMKNQFLKYQESTLMHNAPTEDMDFHRRMKDRIREMTSCMRRENQLPTNRRELLMLLHHMDYRLHHLDVADVDVVADRERHRDWMVDLSNSSRNLTMG